MVLVDLFRQLGKKNERGESSDEIDEYDVHMFQSSMSGKLDMIEKDIESSSEKEIGIILLKYN